MRQGRRPTLKTYNNRYLISCLPTFNLIKKIIKAESELKGVFRCTMWREAMGHVGSIKGTTTTHYFSQHWHIYLPLLSRLGGCIVPQGHSSKRYQPSKVCGCTVSCPYLDMFKMNQGYSTMSLGMAGLLIWFLEWAMLYVSNKLARVYMLYGENNVPHMIIKILN